MFSDRRRPQHSNSVSLFITTAGIVLRFNNRNARYRPSPAVISYRASEYCALLSGDMGETVMGCKRPNRSIFLANVAIFSSLCRFGLASHRAMCSSAISLIIMRSVIKFSPRRCFPVRNSLSHRIHCYCPQTPHQQAVPALKIGGHNGRL